MALSLHNGMRERRLAGVWPAACGHGRVKGKRSSPMRLSWTGTASSTSAPCAFPCAANTTEKWPTFV